MINFLNRLYTGIDIDYLYNKVIGLSPSVRLVICSCFFLYLKCWKKLFSPVFIPLFSFTNVHYFHIPKITKLCENRWKEVENDDDQEWFYVVFYIVLESSFHVFVPSFLAIYTIDFCSSIVGVNDSVCRSLDNHYVLLSLFCSLKFGGICIMGFRCWEDILLLFVSCVWLEPVMEDWLIHTFMWVLDKMCFNEKFQFSWKS